MRWLAFVAVLVAFGGGDVRAEPVPPIATAKGPSENAPAGADERRWSGSAALYTYLLPDDADYLQPTLLGDLGSLHLEARYNYESLETVSLWVGYNLSLGEGLVLELTPMFGGVLGETDGIAPGYKATLSWRRLELYSEGEYLVDAADSADSYFYNWSELTFAPSDWCRLGMVTQRTRAHQSDREIARGPLVGVSWRRLDLMVAALDFDHGQPTVLLGLSAGF